MFHIGDRVRYIGETSPHNCEGTVVCAGFNDVGVRFDKHVGGGNLYGRCESGHGVWCLSHNLALVEPPLFSPAPEADFLSAITG